MKTARRTHTCGALRGENCAESVVLCGWVNRRRDLGGLIFVDIRDRYGMTQVFFDPEGDRELFAKAESLKAEFVIAVEGVVAPRPQGMVNASMPTGEIEVLAKKMMVLNESDVLPFNMNQQSELDENLRMKYRYLDLRRPFMAERMVLRHKIAKAVRDYFDRNGFLEIETPILVNSTPEGARDYLVPSRVHPGHVYALPQSPQLLKQTLMIGGLDRYFQLARCFRDEDLRADRQPEFTQIDVEMSFVEREDILQTIENMLCEVFDKTLDVKLETPFQRLSWHESMQLYGTDKPDLRYDMKIQNVSERIGKTGFKVFDDVLENGDAVKGIVVPHIGSLSRKESDAVIELGKSCGLAGVVLLSYADGNPKSALTKFMSEQALNDLKNHMGVLDNDLVCFAAGNEKTITQALGKLRLELIAHFSLKPLREFAFLWVLDFPMFSFNEEENRLEAEHHPFTSPVASDMHLLQAQPLAVRSNAYDIVLNGIELGSGSIRIHDRMMQERIFQAIGLTKEQAEEKFGYLMKSFEYGAPPHGGIAVGFDRLVANMAGLNNIREVIAFPKNHQAVCPLTNAPVVPSREQLNALNMEFTEKET